MDLEYRLDTYAADERLAKKLGLSLDALERSPESAIERTREVVPVFSLDGEYPLTLLRMISDMHRRNPSPSSVSIGSREELAVIVQDMHETAFGNYVLAIYDGMKPSFPRNCCVESSRNVTLSMMHKGYPSATYVKFAANIPEARGNAEKRHAYVVVPFVFGHEKGVVLGDPTARQYLRSGERSVVEVKSGASWSYPCAIETLRDGRLSLEMFDFYPNNGVLGLSEVRAAARGGRLLMNNDESDFETYLHRAFKNPTPTGRHGSRRHVA